jgi:hypothetical protein
MLSMAQQHISALCAAGQQGMVADAGVQLVGKQMAVHGWWWRWYALHGAADGCAEEWRERQCGDHDMYGMPYVGQQHMGQQHVLPHVHIGQQHATAPYGGGQQGMAGGMVRE